jgi:hypothetical protein
MKIIQYSVTGWYGYVADWIATGWELLGHEVTRMDRKQIGKHETSEYDLEFYVDCSEDYSAAIPPKTDATPLRIFWALDVQMPGGTERSVNIARKCDYTFCTNYEFGVPILKRFGIDSMWVPYGYALEYIIKAEQFRGEEDIDVCMVGNPNSPERRALWKLLAEKYKSKVGRVENEDEYLSAMRNTKIVVSQPTAGFNNIINLRVFNGLAFGKLVLAQRMNIQEPRILGLRDKVNIVYWENLDDLIEKIDYYLQNEKERKRIAQRGRLLGHKYLIVHSVRIIEQVLFSKFYDYFTQKT